MTYLKQKSKKVECINLKYTLSCSCGSRNIEKVSADKRMQSTTNPVTLYIVVTDRHDERFFLLLDWGLTSLYHIKIGHIVTGKAQTNENVEAQKRKQRGETTGRG